MTSAAGARRCHRKATAIGPRSDGECKATDVSHGSPEPLAEPNEESAELASNRRDRQRVSR